MRFMTTPPEPAESRPFSSWHFLWMIPLVVFISPIGIITMLINAPDFAWIPIAGLVIAWCGIAMGAAD